MWNRAVSGENEMLAQRACSRGNLWVMRLEGLQGWSLDLSPLFFHFGPEVGPCLSGLVYEVGLESPFLHWHEGWT